MQSSLKWRRSDRGWQLFNNRQRMGRVVPDTQHPGMWRSIKSSGRLSDMANLSHAKNAVLIEAERELEFEDRRHRAIHPQKSQQKEGVFQAPGSLVRETLEEAVS